MTHTMKPSLDALQAIVKEIQDDKGSENTFPVFKEVFADELNPQTAYLRLAKPGSPGCKPSFLLESAAGGEQLGRFSFIGANPRKVIKTGPTTPAGGIDPLPLIKEELDQYITPRQLEVMPSFQGGAIGYVSYDCVRYFEPKTARDLKDTLEIPEAMVMLCDTVVCFDNVFQKIYIVHNIHVPKTESIQTFDLEAAYGQAKQAIDDIVALLEGPAYHVPQGVVTPNDVYESNSGQAGYEKYVRDLKDHVVKGDIIQAVPSHRISHKTDLHPFNIYRQLRTINPSPYLFYMDFEEVQLIGASPELLVKFEGERIITHPIAGTVKRGSSPEEDDKLAEALQKSEKDRAEHIMLVDLARNDINRVCEPESSKVDSFMKVERFSHVSHLVSQCSGLLRQGLDRFDAFRSIFPAGTVSGAPKVRAMELIAEMEGEKRGVYAGAVGHWGYHKTDMDVCIALRTMVYKNKTVYLQAGGGIVHDSDPYDEYIETMNKMRANRVCVEEAEKYWSEKSD